MMNEIDKLVLFKNDEEEAQRFYLTFKNYDNFEDYLEYTCDLFIT